MCKKRYNKLAAILLLMGVVVILPSPVLATSADRLSLANLEGYPGETIQAQITLQGTEAERSGYWQTYYKQTEGDDARMDITSWVTIEPEDYTIAQGQNLTVPLTARPYYVLFEKTTSEQAARIVKNSEIKWFMLY